VNSQIVTLQQALRSKKIFIAIAAFIAVSLFLKAGFASVAVIWFFVLCLFQNTRSSVFDRIRANYILLFPIAFFLVNVMWILVMMDRESAFNLMLVEIHLLLLPAAFLMLDKSIGNNFLHTVLGLFVLGCLASSIVCYSNAIYAAIKFQSFSDPVNGLNFFFHSNLTRSVEISPVYLSMFANFAFVALWYNTFVVNRAFRISMLIYLAVFVVMIFSITGIITLIMILIVWLLDSKQYKKRTLLVLFAVFITMLATVGLKFELARKEVLFMVTENVNQPRGKEVNSFESRLIIWSSAIETIASQPITGYGFGKGQLALEETYLKNGFNWGVAESFNAHNQFLSIMLDFGLPGLLLLILMLVIPVWRSYKSNDMLAFSFLVVVFLFFLTETVLSRQKGVVFFSLFYSLLFNHFRTNEPLPRSSV
jgi:O-antigen ligase